tara:strand:- start:48 stop:842 length:795 start_codon:yes stop_codon:yes gene_type:complete
MARLKDKQFDKNKWAEMLKIKQAEDKAVKEALRANKAAGLMSEKPGQSPGDDRTKDPYDKNWPGRGTSPRPEDRPKLAGAQDINTKTNPLQDGSFLDEDGNRYLWSPRGGKFIDMGPYDPDFHGLPLPLAQNRNGMMVAHAGPGQFYDETGNVTDTHPYKFNRNTTELEVPWLKEQYYDDLPRREQMHEQLDHTSLMMRPEILLANAADVPLGDGMIRQTMNQVQQSNKQKYDLMYQEGFINRQQYEKQMKRTFGKNYEQFLID